MSWKILWNALFGLDLLIWFGWLTGRTHGSEQLVCFAVAIVGGIWLLITIVHMIEQALEGKRP